MRNDLDVYERHAASWWNRGHAAFRSLHSVNEFRVALLAQWLAGELRGATVIDLGCGGGLLCAAVREMGARVLGFDLSLASLRSARAELGGTFVRADLRRVPLCAACADVVLLADVLEHVSEPAVALDEAARLLRPGGACYVSTINRTAKARWLAVHVAEGVGLIPRGTHDADLFVSPAELERDALAAGLVLERVQGERVRVWPTVRRRAIVLERSDDVSVAYSALLRKPDAQFGAGDALQRLAEGSA